MEVTLCEIESVLNSRPLTTTANQEVLTPGHFLRVHYGNLQSNAIGLPDIAAHTLAEIYAISKAVVEKFWNMWHLEYLTNLPKVVRNCNTTSDIKLGTLVLLREDPPRPRLQWPMGIISKIFPGRDGRVRMVEVRTHTGRYLRPIQRIHKLEMDYSASELVSNKEIQHEEERHYNLRSRAERRVN